MSSLPKTIHTAGKITILTSIVGVVVFAAMFFLNLGAEEFQQARAQDVATTSVTVLNTPPQWTIDAEEEFGSSTTTPTNSGTQVSWVAVGTDSNAQPYFLLICSTSVAPITTNGSSTLGLGNVPPRCGAGAIQWAVSTGTVSGTEARAATTTLESFDEENDWYAWICDDDFINARCNAAFRQGSGTTSSPFYVNHRPNFTAFTNDSTSPTDKLPGETVTFTATASDNDTVTDADTVQLFVCSTQSFNVTTRTCDAITLASSSLSASNPTATYTIAIPTRDRTYGAYGYIVDNHGHAADSLTQGSDSVLTVGNASPYVNASDIILNDIDDLILSIPAGETPGFELTFQASDNNSCVNATSGLEVNDYEVSVFRTDIGTSSCNAAGDYNPNNCYPSTVATSTWNISCTASSTSCGGPTDLSVLYECTFPLWYVADPTFGGATNTPFSATDWSAAVKPIDDNNAEGVLTRGTITKELYSFLAFALDVVAIPYGALEPGERTDPLVASTTMRATGNVGLDKLLSGESMCTTYTSAVTCPTSATSTIADRFQVFATSTISYASATSSGYILSSTTPFRLDVNIPKSTATSTQASGYTYWGIEVPITITLAGAYTGENTIFGVVGDVAGW